MFSPLGDCRRQGSSVKYCLSSFCPQRARRGPRRREMALSPHGAHESLSSYLVSFYIGQGRGKRDSRGQEIHRDPDMEAREELGSVYHKKERDMSGNEAGMTSLDSCRRSHRTLH